MAVPPLGGEQALHLLATMWRIRLFEERVGQLKRADEVHGLVHLSVGQEGVAAAVCTQLRDDDAVYSGHRAHGHAIAKGAPLDTQTILESVGKTGRLVLVDQATRHASAATVIAGEVAEHGFSSLKAPIVQVTALDATIPYSEPLEAWVMPNEDKIVAAVQRVVGAAPVTA